MTTFTQPSPPGVQRWLSDSEPDGDQAIRYFLGTEHGSVVGFDMTGSQRADGTVRRQASVFLPHGVEVAELDAEGLRQLAADALATADELEALGNG